MAGESATAVARRRLEKAERLQRSAARYLRGAEGEQITAEALEQLPDESWVVLHDVAWPGRRRANIDHVVVGPGGVFVIDSKLWSGEVTLVDGVLRQNRRSRAAAVQGVEAAAHAVRALLTGVPGDHVHAVLCLAQDDLPAGRAGGVLVCGSADLADLLTSRPALSAQAVSTVAGEAARLLHPADAPRDVEEPVAEEPVVEEPVVEEPVVLKPVAVPVAVEPASEVPDRLPRSRPRPSVVLAALVAGGVAALALTQPQLVSSAAGAADDATAFVTGLVSSDEPAADPPADAKPGKADKGDKADKKKSKTRGEGKKSDEKSGKQKRRRA